MHQNGISSIYHPRYSVIIIPDRHTINSASVASLSTAFQVPSREGQWRASAAPALTKRLPRGRRRIPRHSRLAFDGPGARTVAADCRACTAPGPAAHCRNKLVEIGERRRGPAASRGRACGRTGSGELVELVTVQTTQGVPVHHHYFSSFRRTRRGWGRGCGPGTNSSTKDRSASSTGPSSSLVLNFFRIQCFYISESKCLELRPHAWHVVLFTQRSQEDLNVCSPCIGLLECLVHVGTGRKGKHSHGLVKDVKHSWGDHNKGGSIGPATHNIQPSLRIITHY